MDLLLLVPTIACGVLGTLMLRASQGLRRAGPTALAVVAFVLATVGLARLLLVLPVTLGLTVACEVTATLCIKASDGLTEVLPSAAAVTGFILTTLLLAKVVEVIPTSIAYTIWTGSGAVAVSVLGVALFDDHLTRLAWVGIGLVVLGVASMNLQPGNSRAGSRAKEPDELAS